MHLFGLLSRRARIGGLSELNGASHEIVGPARMEMHAG